MDKEWILSFWECLNVNETVAENQAIKMNKLSLFNQFTPKSVSFLDSRINLILPGDGVNNFQTLF